MSTIDRRAFLETAAAASALAALGPRPAASWPETTRSRENLMAQADAALYAAKSGGRNRVERAERGPD